MADRTVISAHTRPEIAERLGKLATATKRSKSFLVGEAIERYLADEEAFIASVERGLAQAEAGEGVSTDEARVQITSRLEARAESPKA